MISTSVLSGEKDNLERDTYSIMFSSVLKIRKLFTLYICNRSIKTYAGMNSCSKELFTGGRKQKAQLSLNGCCVTGYKVPKQIRQNVTRTSVKAS